jgi:hypothetical protein
MAYYFAAAVLAPVKTVCHLECGLYRHQGSFSDRKMQIVSTCVLVAALLRQDGPLSPGRLHTVLVDQLPQD